MNQQQIDWLNALDKDKTYGTLQCILSEGNLNIQQFEKVLMFLVQSLIVERETILRENKKFSEVLKEKGLYTAKLVLGE